MKSTIYNRVTMSVALNAQEAEALRRFIMDNLMTYSAHVADTRRIVDDLWRQRVDADYNYRTCREHGNQAAAKHNKQKLESLDARYEKEDETEQKSWEALCAASELKNALEQFFEETGVGR